MKVIINAVIVMPDRLIENGTIWIQDGLISDYGTLTSLPPPRDAVIIDAEGLYVAPGFVDIHCHGGGGYFAYKNPSEFARFHLNFGTTSILTTISYNESEQETMGGLHRVLEAQKGPYGTLIAGIHMEGPYINPKYGAITSPIRPVNPTEYRAILELAGSSIKVWTLAPELEGQKQFMEEALCYGIALSVGHSEAEAKTILDSVQYGMKIGCHITNASGITPSPTRYPGTREVGVDEAILLSDEMYAEVIPDREGRHVRPLMLQLILKTKGVDKVIIITDAFDQAGLPGNPFDVNMTKKTEFSPGQANEEMLSGSLLTMDQAARNMRLHTGVGITDIFRMASLNPARAIGIDGEVGSLERGKRANLIFLNDHFDIHKIIFEGEVI